MTASLYQRRRSVEDSSLFASATCLSSLSSANMEDVRRKGLRVELHEVASAAPGVAAAAQQIPDRVAAARRAVEVDPARLRVVGIQIDRHQDDARSLLLGIAQQLVVVRRMEAQAPVRLQRGVLPPDPVQARDQRPQAVGALAIPALDLVLFRVQILLAARLARQALHQLE